MVTIRTSNRRLLALAEFLETSVPRRKFYYGKFVGDNWQGNPGLKCKTTACALGWAAVMPQFRRLGLQIIDTAPMWEKELGFHAASIVNPKHGVTSPNSELEAAIVTFGITYTEAEYIFVPYTSPWKIKKMRHSELLDTAPANDATAKQVAKHIRTFVAAR